MSFPFIIRGKVTDLDGVTGLNNCLVYAKNKVSNAGVFDVTDSNGDYALDLLNAYESISAGDIISVKIRKDNKCRIKNFTITQTMINNGGYIFNLQIYGVRQHVFDVLWTLYDDNLPPSFLDTDKITHVDWKITSSMPEDNPEFPLIIIHPIKITNGFANIGFDMADDEIIIETEFFSRARFGKATIDSARDYMEYILKNNQSTLNYAGLYFQREFIDDSTVGMLLFSDQKYNLANQILKFRWSP